MLNMGIANVSPPPPPSAGPTVRVCRYVMDFDVVFECDHVGDSTQSGIFSNISGFRMRVHHFET